MAEMEPRLPQTGHVEWSFTPVFPFDLRGHSRRPQVEWEVEWEVERDDTFKVEWESYIMRVEQHLLVEVEVDIEVGINVDRYRCEKRSRCRGLGVETEIGRLDAVGR